MSNVRAKFRCVKAEYSAYGPAIRYAFAPQYEPDVPEDQRYSKATPSGELWMNVDNQDVSFELGAFYYLTLTPVEG
mgnify:FL=1